MRLESRDAAGILSELAGLPPERRAAALRAAGPVDELLPALAEHVERLAMSEISQALEASELVLALTDAVGNGAQRARAHRARGQTLAYAGQFEPALDILSLAVTQAESAGSRLEAARARMASIHPLNSLGRFDDSIAAGESARLDFVAAGEMKLAARADSNLGVTHRFRDDPAAALRHYDRARPLLADEPIALAQLDSNRGISLQDLDAFSAAQEAFGAALPTFEKAEMSWAAAIVEGNLAELATRQGRLQRALFHFERARRHLERDTADAEVARLLAEQADAVAVLGLLDDAIEGYKRAIPQLETHGLATESVRARAGLGRAYLAKRQFDEAEPLLAEVAREYDALGQRAARAKLDLARAELLTALGRTAEARDLAADALSALSDRPADAALARYHLARSARASGDFAAAEHELSVALNTAVGLDLAPLLADLLHARGALRREYGDLAAATTDLRAAVTQVERIRGSLQAERFRAGCLGNRLALYEDLVHALIERGEEFHGEVFAVVEQAKSRSLLDALRGGMDSADRIAARPNDSTAEAAESDQLREFTRIRTTLNAYYSRLADGHDDSLTSAEQTRRRDEIRRHEQELESLECRLANARGIAALYAPPISLPAVQARLATDAALVEYFVMGDELLSLVVRHDAIHIVRQLTSMSAVADVTEQVHFQLRRGLRPGSTEGPRGERLIADARRVLSGAFDMLVRPLRRHLDGASRLFVVPHGPLHTIPFAALHDGERYLVEQYEIINAPSSSVLWHSADNASRQSAVQRALVVGVADEVAPQIELEARRVADALRAETLLIGAEATREKLEQAAAESRVVHIAAHGFFSTDNPLAAGLRLADGWLTVRDVFAMRLRADLVTLSGCETGRTVIGGGDELLGLARGFLAAGARALLVSLWTVHDASTSELMERFYQNWTYNQERGAIACLRAAQQEVMGVHPHPVHWAPFILIGDA